MIELFEQELINLNLHDKSFLNLKVDFYEGILELLLQDYDDDKQEHYENILRFSGVQKLEIPMSEGFYHSEIATFRTEVVDNDRIKVTFDMMQTLNNLAEWQISLICKKMDVISIEDNV